MPRRFPHAALPLFALSGCTTRSESAGVTAATTEAALSSPAPVALLRRHLPRPAGSRTARRTSRRSASRRPALPRPTRGRRTLATRATHGRGAELTSTTTSSLGCLSRLFPRRTLGRTCSTLRSLHAPRVTDDEVLALCPALLQLPGARASARRRFRRAGTGTTTGSGTASSPTCRSLRRRGLRSAARRHAFGMASLRVLPVPRHVLPHQRLRRRRA